MRITEQSEMYDSMYEYSQELHYYPYALNLDRCVGSGNALNDLSNKLSVPNKTKDLNLSVFKMIKGIND